LTFEISKIQNHLENEDGNWYNFMS